VAVLASALSIDSLDVFAEFSQTYYLEPRPDLLPAALDERKDMNTFLTGSSAQWSCRATRSIMRE
jgi:hypothetical protein